METCHNCGLPEDCISTTGRKVVLHFRPQPGEKFKRERRQSTWCHSDECAIQALAVAQYGAASHKWPLTLAEFRSTDPLAANEKRPSRYSLEYKQGKMLRAGKAKIRLDHQIPASQMIDSIG